MKITIQHQYYNHERFLNYMFLLPLAAGAQVYDRSSADRFKYKEIGDTIFINDHFFVPGDTLFLGKGSAPDKSFPDIYESRGHGFFCVGPRFTNNAGIIQPFHIANAGNFHVSNEQEKIKDSLQFRRNIFPFRL